MYKPYMKGLYNLGMVWQKLDVECMWSARQHNQQEDIGSNPIGIDQKENFLKVQVMKKQHK